MSLIGSSHIPTLDFGCLLRLGLFGRDDLVPVDLGDLSGLAALPLSGRLVLRLDLPPSVKSTRVFPFNFKLL